jgi:hypothetical protein
MSGSMPVIQPLQLNQTPGSNSTFGLPQQGVGSNLMQGLLSASYGPGYQDLLNTGTANPSGGGNGTSWSPQQDAQAALLRSQAQVNSARASAISGFQEQQRMAQQLSSNLARGGGGVPSAFGNYGGMAQDRQDQSQLNLLNSILGDSARVSQAASMGPTAGGGAQQSQQQNYMVGRPATGNPYGSGWINPSQAWGMSSLGQSALGIMNQGI